MTRANNVFYNPVNLREPIIIYVYNNDLFPLKKKNIITMEKSLKKFSKLY